MAKIGGISLTMVILLTTSGLADSATLPQWSENDWFEVDQVLSLQGSLETQTFFLELYLASVQWTVTSREIRELPHCGPIEVYVLTFAETELSGAGHFTITDPVLLDVEIQIRNGSASGELLVRTDNLNPVAYRLSGSGQVYAFYFGNWMDIGMISLSNLLLEFCPFLEDVQWPLSVGRTWTSTTLMYITGYLEADLVFFGVPYDYRYDFNHEQTFTFTGGCTGMEEFGGCETYRIDLENTLGPGSMITHYCPDANILWYKRKSLVDFYFEEQQGQGSITLNELTWNVRAGYHQQPTPTPLPSDALTCTLELNQTTYYPDDWFLLLAKVWNPTDHAIETDLYILLQVFDTYFSYPTWEECWSSLLATPMIFEPGLTTIEILNFTWPSGAGTLRDGLYFHVGIAKRGTYDFYCFHSVGFGYMEPELGSVAISE